MSRAISLSKQAAQARHENKLALTRDRIRRDADPIGFLIKVAAGKRVKASPTDTGKLSRLMYPTLDQRIKANEMLAQKIVPDLKSVDVTMDQQGNIIVKLGKVEDEEVNTPGKAIARAVTRTIEGTAKAIVEDIDEV